MAITLSFTDGSYSYFGRLHEHNYQPFRAAQFEVPSSQIDLYAPATNSFSYILTRPGYIQDVKCKTDTKIHAGASE